MCLAASAQFVPVTPGTVLKYNMKSQNPETKDSISAEITMRVLSATDADGKINVAVEESISAADKMMSDTTVYVYNPADKSTLIPMENADDAIADMIVNIKEMYLAAGKFISDDELKSQISGRGEISLLLSPDMPAGTKLDKKNLRINMGESSFTFNLWEGLSQGNETVTVPAGTFDCLKITYVYKMTTPQSTVRQYVTQWFAPEIGVVRNLITDKKGNVLGEQVLQSITK